MKSCFVAYRFSGEPTEVLEERLKAVVDSLKKAGLEAYCNLFDNHIMDSKTLSKSEIMQKAFGQIDVSDRLFVLIASDDKSEGQLIEVGYALAKKIPVVTAVQADVKTHLTDLSDKVVIWNDLADLKNKLEGLRV